MSEPGSKNTAPVRVTGIHPFDAVLADRRLLGWGGSLLDLLRRQWRILLAGALAIALVQLITPLLAISHQTIELRLWPRLIDSLVALTLSSFVYAASYAALARREGAAHGLAHVEPWQSLPLRGLLLASIWGAVGLILTGVALLIVFSLVKLFASSALSGGGLAGLLALGYAGALFVPLLLFLLAPLWVGMLLRYALSYARIVRTDESAWTAFSLAWQRVSAENWRYFSHAYVAMLLVAAVLAAYIAVRWVAPGPIATLTSILLGMASLMVTVAGAFVAERALDPSLGLTLGAAPPSDPAATPTAGATAAAANDKAKQAPTTLAPLDTPTFQSLIAAQARDPREVRTLLGRCTDQVAALHAVRQQILPLAQSPRLAEAIVLVEAALTHDARHFANDPDIIMPLAKRLAAGARSDLAVRLLQPFVREQQQHKLHLTAALYAAHLVAQTLNKPTVARQFLANLKRLYPHEPLIDQQLKRLPT
ncbi:MAG: hypothetical protein IPG25_11320 [Proteobacteria bacterium]|nr:hypothetical protein [Pseudomonadota bacterium]